MKKNNKSNWSGSESELMYPTSVRSLQKSFPQCSVNQIIDAVRVAGPDEQDIRRYLEVLNRGTAGLTGRTYADFGLFTRKFYAL
ncbi:MAG: hypothetical protein ACTHLE_08040 [Agriterribacter sp.]